MLRLHNWLVLSFVDKNGGSASVPGDSDGMFTDNCTFTPAPAPSCATLKANKEKLSSLTFAYTGGGCPGDNDQGDKSSCSGSIDPVEGVTVQAGEKVDNLNYPVQPMFVAPDGEFTIDPDKFKSNSVLVASNTDGTETNEFHTSCSQPLAVGDVFGSFTLVAINGQHGSTEVTYQYKVTNNGDPLTGIVVTDVPLGDIGTIPTLGKGASDTLSKTVRILGTTVQYGYSHWHRRWRDVLGLRYRGCGGNTSAVWRDRVHNEDCGYLVALHWTGPGWCDRGVRAKK